MRDWWVYRNLPNIVSILGVLPIALLLREDGVRFLVPLLIYNNFMDDLDGQLAVKLDLRSEFGATLDNLCDAVASVFFVIYVGMNLGTGVSITLATVVVVSILIRMTSRMVPSPQVSGGSPTNELMRHLALLFVSAEYLGWNAQPWVLAVFSLNAVSMLVTYTLPYSLRTLTTTTTTIALLNVSLVVAWLVPATAPFVALGFLSTYLYSFIAGAVTSRKQVARSS